MTEQDIQNLIRLEASRIGAILWRNNSGAYRAEDGRLVRYGLGNDSAAMNRVIKSSDLIGITPYVVKPDDVGGTLGIFTSVEVKAPGWVRSTNAREAAQDAWIQVVRRYGGRAGFATSVMEYRRVLGV